MTMSLHGFENSSILFTTPHGYADAMSATDGFLADMITGTAAPVETGKTMCVRDSGGGDSVFTFHMSGILLISIVCVICNSLVIFVMAKNRNLDSPLNYVITSLAVSDLLQGVAYGAYNLSHINVDNIRYTLGNISLYICQCIQV